MSLLHNYYERKANCNAILFKVTVRCQALRLQLGLTVRPCRRTLIFIKTSVGAIIVKFFRVAVEDSYCERLESYSSAGALLL